MAKPIYFYSRTDEYSELSNFAPFGFEEGWERVKEDVMRHALRRKFAQPHRAAFGAASRG